MLVSMRWTAAPIVLLFFGCTPTKSAAPPPPPPHLGPIEKPEDIVGELLVRDPLGLTETLSKASGRKEDPLGLLTDPDLAEAVKLLDLHATAAMAMLGDPRHTESWKFAAAVHVKDPKDARAKLAEQTSKGKLKASESPAIRSKIYVVGKSAMSLLGDCLVIADSPATIESSGRWIGKEADGTPPHEISLHVPLSRWSGQLEGEAKKWLDAELQKDADMAAIGPLASKLVDLIGDLGDIDMALDLEKQDAVVDFKLGAAGGLAEWLGKFPAGSPRSILALPRGSGAFVVRLPDSVSEMVKGLFDDEAKKAPAPKKKEIDDLRVFARSIGHEIALVYAEKAKPGESPKPNEALLRIEITDPTGAKAAIKSLVADWTSKPDHKIVRSPWSKSGADGEQLTITEGSEKHDVRWAIKGNYLFLDYADEGKTTLIDAAVDPNAKALLGNDLRAKTFADRLPKEGLAFAYYAQTSAAPKPEELGAVPGLDGIRWGWISATKSGVASAWNLPLADLATYAGTKALF